MNEQILKRCLQNLITASNTAKLTKQEHIELEKNAATLNKFITDQFALKVEAKKDDDPDNDETLNTQQ